MNVKLKIATMKVILLQDVKKLGRKNDVKNVNDGYARNFLIPKKIAVLATDSELEELDRLKGFELQEAEEDLMRAQDLASKIDGLEIEIAAKVGENEKLFGAVSAAKISEKLKALGFEVEKEYIKLEESIKETGEHDLVLELPHGLEAKIKVVIVPEE